MIRSAEIVQKKFSGTIPDTYEEFINLPGVGPYMASAVLSIAHGKPFAVVDGNVKRVLSRLFSLDFPVNTHKSDKYYRTYADQLLYTEDPGNFNQAIMELGALICRPKSPDCGICPVKENCLALSEKCNTS